ncbi:unnamed protein product [Rhizoctonia solani]|uniref:F-box domain-containing protein n=1 Tax=Rhizoctonia solani TaxID=456999 RepID=A0A8H2WTM0_9AGAM|nr:unnamed protein product [Rhizoctonia solani]
MIPALTLPEIVQHIVSVSGYREQCKLAYTCKRLFDAVVPVIWRDLAGVHIVMKLIPGVNIAEEYSYSAYGMVWGFKDITIDDTALAENWTRYWIYAPLVKHLTAFATRQCPRGETFRIQGWQFLLPKLQLEGGTLLPNLLSLNTGLLAEFTHPEQLAWSALLLSPSIQRLHLHDLALETAIEGAVRPLDLLLQGLPRSLPQDPSLSPPVRDKWQQPEATFASLFPSVYQAGSNWFRIAALSDLRYLIIHSPGWPNEPWDELYVLGCLPRLEELQIDFLRSDISNKSQTNTSPLPSSSFPSLRTLTLNSLPNRNVFFQISDLIPKVPRLSSVNLSVSGFILAPDDFADCWSQLKRSPNLVDLSLTMDFHNMGALHIAYKILSEKPLEALGIYSRQMGEYPISYLDKAFPHLRRLNLMPPFELADWSVLPKIAKAFPNLELLCMKPRGFNMVDTLGRLDTSGHLASQKIEIRLVHDSYQHEFLVNGREGGWNEAGNQVINFLRRIWPNAVVVPEWQDHYSTVWYDM